MAGRAGEVPEPRPAAAGEEVAGFVGSIRVKAAGGVLTAKQAPHRPGTAPAPGLRAEVCSFQCTADHI